MEMVMVIRPRNIVSLVSLAFECVKRLHIRLNPIKYSSRDIRDIRDIRDMRDRYRSKMQCPLKNITQFKPRDTRDIRDTRDNLKTGISLNINL